MNKITVIGNLTKDLELKETTKGHVANGVLAVTRDYNRDVTDFINFTLWNKAAETAAKYVSKGSKVAIHGSLHIDKNNDKLYTSISVENIEFLSTKITQDTKPEATKPKTELYNYGQDRESEKEHISQMKEETEKSDLPF
jgi:single-strand DNA-binding protein